MSTRATVIGRVADRLVTDRRGHPLRVAVDGVTASGKSTFASELTNAVRARGREAIHLSTDDFHHPRVHRRRQGADSGDGYYEDAFDLDAFARLVLDPLGPDGDGRYRGAIHDLDQPVDTAAVLAPVDAVVVVDGSFMQKPELAGRWDVVVYLDTSLDVVRARGTRRDADLFGGRAEAERAYDVRYHAAARRYLAVYLQAPTWWSPTTTSTPPRYAGSDY